MMISKTIWFWKLGFYKRAGWWRDGGIWPRLRIVRRATLDDYFYGTRSNKGSGLARVISERNALAGGIDRSEPGVWRPSMAKPRIGK